MPYMVSIPGFTSMEQEIVVQDDNAFRRRYEQALQERTLLEARFRAPHSRQSSKLYPLLINPGAIPWITLLPTGTPPTMTL